MLQSPPTAPPPSPAGFPYIPQPLLDELNRRFPERCPRISDHEREVWMAAGRREVVCLLNRHAEEQRGRLG